MTNVQKFEKNFLLAVSKNDMALITSTVNSIPTKQIPLINPDIYASVLVTISHYTYTTNNLLENSTLLANSTARNFMQKAGAYVPAHAIGEALLTFSYAYNMDGIDAVTDYISNAQKPFLDSLTLGHVLNNIVDQTLSSPHDDIAINTAARDFMQKLGAFVPAKSIDGALLTFSYDHNFSGIDAITDYISNAQKPFLDSLTLGHVLHNIVNQTLSSEDDTAVNTAARDFMVKLGAFVPASAIDEALLTFSYDHNFSGIDAITDYITDAHKPLLNPYALSRVLTNIVDQTGSSEDDTAVNTAARDFMQKLGAFVPAPVIGEALLTFSYDHNFSGIDAITDYIPKAQKPFLDSLTLGHVLNNIIDQTGSSEDDTAVNTAARDFMTKFGAFVPAPAIGEALLTFSYDHNFDGIDAVTDYISKAQKLLLDSLTLGHVLNNIVDQTWSSQDDTAVNLAARDFMVKLGAFVAVEYIGQSLITMAHDHNYAGIDSIVENLSDNQIANLGVSGYIHHLESQDIFFSTSFTETTYAAPIGEIIMTLDGNDTAYSGAGDDFTFGNKGNDVLYGENGNDFLSGGLGVDTLHGGTGGDTFAFTNTSSTDTVADFRVSDGDKLDLSEILTMFDPLTDAIADFVHFTSSASNTIVSVDMNGLEAGANFVNVALLQNVTADTINVTDMYNTGTLIA